MAEYQETVGSHQYRFDRMSLFSAMDISRIWTYALLMLAKAPADLAPAGFAKSFPTFISFVPKSENDYAMNLCLGTAKRAIAGDKGWAPLIGASGQLAYQDMSLTDLYEIVFHALKANELINFFGAPPAPLDGAGGETSS